MKNHSINSLYKGRLNRKDFALGFLIALVTLSIEVSLSSIATGLISSSSSSTSPTVQIVGFLTGIIILIILVAYFVFFLYSLNVRRLHDIGYSGWYFLLLLVPIVGAFLFVYICVKKGMPTANKYGEVPQKKNFIKAVFNF